MRLSISEVLRLCLTNVVKLEVGVKYANRCTGPQLDSPPRLLTYCVTLSTNCQTNPFQPLNYTLQNQIWFRNTRNGAFLGIIAMFLNEILLFRNITSESHSINQYLLQIICRINFLYLTWNCKTLNTLIFAVTPVISAGNLKYL